MSAIALTIPGPMKRDPIIVFILFSLLLHFLLFVLWPQLQRSSPPLEQLTEVELLPPETTSLETVPPALPPPDQPKEKELIPPEVKQEPPPTLPENQIVSVPDEVNELVPDQTRFLSDKNTSVEEQTVAIGTPLSNPQLEEENRVAQEQPKEPPKQLALNTRPDDLQNRAPNTNALDKALREADKRRDPRRGNPQVQREKPQLFARQDDLLAKGWLSTDGESEKEEAQRTPPSGNELLAMAPPPARENFLTMPGPRGTLDHLPDVRKGNLTFLNTKASRFAPFVRRVAQRVFQNLLIEQRSLDIEQVLAAQKFVQIGAKLDGGGTLKGLTIHTGSGSYAVDESLLAASRVGAWDENPPPEAVSDDGHYHFVFRSEINAQFDASGLRAIIAFLSVGLL